MLRELLPAGAVAMASSPGELAMACDAVPGTLEAALHSVWAKYVARSDADADDEGCGEPVLEPIPPLLHTATEKAEATFLSEQSDTRVATVYHAIRQIPYGGVGVRRTVEGVLEARCGSCSGKHMALTSLLARLGHTVELLTLHCDFSAAVALHAAAVSAEGALCNGALTRYNAAPVHDFHHVVRLTRPETEVGGSVLLDATWPDCLAPHGFRVNTGWADGGDTQLAVPDTAIYQRIEAVSVAQLGPMKAELVATLPAAQAERRAAFFRDLLVWLTTLQQPAG